MIRFSLFTLAFLAACASPPQVLPPPTDSVATPEPAPPVELLHEGDVLFDREPPPFPDSALADSIREVYRNGIHATAMIVTEAYALDSLGQEIPLTDVLREAAFGIPDSAKAFLHFTVAWDGTPVRAEVVRVTGDVPTAVVLGAIARIRFRPTWFDSMGPDIPRDTPIPYSTRFFIPFSRSWLD